MSWEFMRREGSKETRWDQNEKDNALDYLETAVRYIMDVERTPWAWKWVCIALHGALYSFDVCALQGTNFELVLQGNTVFRWDKIPGEDDGRLIEFLTKKFDIYWSQTARIEKTEDGKVIKVSTEKNSLSLKLNDRNFEVIMVINGNKSKKLIAKMDHDGLKICKKENPNLISFDEVIKRIQDKNFIMRGVISKPLVLNENQKQAIKFMKNELRNPLEHFIPCSRSLEIHGLPEMAASYFEIIEYLAGDSGNLRWNDEEIARIKALCNSGKSLALTTKAHWELSEAVP